MAFVHTSPVVRDNIERQPPAWNSPRTMIALLSESGVSACLCMTTLRIGSGYWQPGALTVAGAEVSCVTGHRE